MSDAEALRIKEELESKSPDIRAELHYNDANPPSAVLHVYQGKYILGMVQEDGSWYDMMRD